MIRLILIAAAIGISATADRSVAQVRRSSVPEVGEQRTVSIGSAIHEYNEYVPVELAIPESEMRGGQWIIPIVIPEGTPLYPVETRAAFKACADFGNGACGLDDDGDGTFDRMARDSITAALRLRQPVRYTRTIVPLDAPNNLRQTILYQGAAGDSLRLSYREFRGDLARPAFTEELSVPITSQFPQDIVVKDIRFRLFRLDGVGLTYAIVGTP